MKTQSLAGIVILFSFAIFFVSKSTAADSRAVDLHVDVVIGNSDTTGDQVVYYLREDIRKSAAYRLVNADGVGWYIKLVTVSDDNEASTAYSVALVFRGTNGVELYMTSLVGVCGENKVRQCAGSILASVDEYIENFKTKVLRSAKE